MPGVSRYPEETPISDLERRLAILEGIIRQRFLESQEQIANGSSTEVVTHGLGVDPSSVFLTSRANVFIWITAVGVTTFTVNRSGTSGILGFYWLAVP